MFGVLMMYLGTFKVIERNSETSLVGGGSVGRWKCGGRMDVKKYETGEKICWKEGRCKGLCYQKGEKRSKSGWFKEEE